MNPTEPGQDTQATDRRLDCGRDPLDVLDRAHSGASTPHEQNCPYCQAVIAAGSAAHAATLELTDVEREYSVPPTLLPRVMRGVWADLRRTTMIPLNTEHGSGFVADHTVAAVIEHTLDQLLSLRIHTCTATLHPAIDSADSTGSDTRAAPGTLAIAVTAAMAFNADMTAVAARARRLTARTVAEQFGWTAEPIDIDIVDVFLPDSDPTPGDPR